MTNIALVPHYQIYEVSFWVITDATAFFYYFAIECTAVSNATIYTASEIIQVKLLISISHYMEKLKNKCLCKLFRSCNRQSEVKWKVSTWALVSVKIMIKLKTLERNHTQLSMNSNERIFSWVKMTEQHFSNRYLKGNSLNKFVGLTFCKLLSWIGILICISISLKFKLTGLLSTYSANDSIKQSICSVIYILLSFDCIFISLKRT